jgi:hypothetical protein
MAKKATREATAITGTVPAMPSFVNQQKFLFTVVFDAPPSAPLSPSDIVLDRPYLPGTFANIDVCAGHEPNQWVIQGTYSSGAWIVDGRGRRLKNQPDIEAIGNLTITITVAGKKLPPKPVKASYSIPSP